MGYDAGRRGVNRGGGARGSTADLRRICGGSAAEPRRSHSAPGVDRAAVGPGVPPCARRAGAV